MFSNKFVLNYSLCVILCCSICLLSACNDTELNITHDEIRTAQEIKNMRNLGMVLQNYEGRQVKCVNTGWNNYVAELDNVPIVEGIGACYLFVDDWLYYTDSTFENGLFRINIASRKCEKVCDEVCGEVIQYGDFIYYTSLAQDGLMKMNFDGTESKQIAEGDIHSIFPYRENLFYCIGSTLYKLDLDSTSSPEAILDDNIRECFIIDEYVYYYTYPGYELKSYSLNNGTIETIFKGDLHMAINFYQNSILVSTYVGRTYSPETHLIELKTQKDKLICRDTYDTLFATEERIYGYEGIGDLQEFTF